MDFFDRASQIAQSVGENVVNSARNVGTTIKYSTPEKRELAGLKVQLECVNKKLDGYYIMIGRRYTEYIENLATENSFDVSDILEDMKPELENKSEIEDAIAKKEQQIKNAEKEAARMKAQEAYEHECQKLENALRMDVITVEEYEEKVALAQKKYENYDILRKLKMQLSMQIITKEEYIEKVKAILTA